MILSLLLKNWRTHKDTLIEFGKGTNLIIGIMGSGKSAMLNGLSYALYGTFPALRRRELSAGDIILHGQSEAETSVVFEYNKKKYTVSRKLLKKDKKLSVAAKISEDGKILEVGQARVNEVVSELLEMDYELFTRAIYSEQNNIDYFITIEPGRRKKEMDRLLGLDRFETARVSAVSVLNRISSEYQILSSSVNSSELKSLVSDYAEKEEKVSILLKQNRVLEEERGSAKQKITDFSKDVSTLEDTRKKYESLKSSYERTHARLESISAELKEKSFSSANLSKLTEKLNTVSKQKQQIYLSFAALEKEIALHSSNLGKISSLLETANATKVRISKLQTELKLLLKNQTPPSLKKAIEDLESKSISMFSKMETLKAEISELKKISATLKPDYSECPLCGSELSEEKSRYIKEEKEKLIAEKKEEFSVLEGTLPKVKSELEQTRAILRKVEQLSGLIAGLPSKTADIPELEEKKAESLSKMDALTKKRKVLHVQREEIETEHSRVLFLRKEEETMLKKAESLKLLKEQFDKAKTQLELIDFKESKLTELRAMLTKAQLEEANLRSKLELTQRECTLLEESLPILKKRITALEKAKTDSEYLFKLREEMVLYKNALLDLQGELRSELTSAISLAMNEIWPVLYPYSDYTQIRLIGTDKDYFFEVYDGEWRSLERVASGGERACLSLTLRMALTTILTPKIGWMFLDEPTHNLDKDAVHTLSEALENKVPQIIPQSIVITHQENLISSEFAKSYKFSRNKATLGPTIVELI